MEFQFTPLREGRPKFRGLYILAFISIHAPPRGATRVLDVPRCADEISIHAPPRGATAGAERYAFPGGYFNSRPSARGDGKNNIRTAAQTGFQFTPLREGRLSKRSRVFAVLMKFQFTPLREGRQVIIRR